MVVTSIVNIALCLQNAYGVPPDNHPIPCNYAEMRRNGIPVSTR